MKVAVIGAGAAGCFCAIQLKRVIPSAEVVIFEAGRRPLAKLAVTGGGRCNLTNSFEGIENLSDVYPRGAQLMKRALKVFSHTDVCRWFENEGIPLVVQDDHCVFPRSQDAMQIVNTLLRLCRQLGIHIHCLSRVSSIENLSPENQRVSSIETPENQAGEGRFLVRTEPSGNGNGTGTGTADAREMRADCVVVTTGGSPKLRGLSMLSPLGMEIVPPIPSLFSFNVPGQGLNDLMGTVVENAGVRIPGTKFSGSGPLLITHWGLSGPAALRLSSHAARHLAEKQYCSAIQINWLGKATEEDARELLSSLSQRFPSRLCAGTHPEALPARLWQHLLRRSGMREDIRWAETGRKGLSRLSSTLVCDCYETRGRARFKDEFVTCGGVALSEISMKTLESKKHPGLYLGGEVLDVDAVTGGFNLQAAWSMGYIIACSVARL